MSSASSGIDVSIVIINYNTPELTHDCVESVIRETSGLVYEIIVVDNGSDDPSALTARLEGLDEVAVIRSERNLGFAGGNNLGVGYCKGEHILLLNSDTLLANNAIRLTLNELEGDPQVGAVSAKLMFPDGKLQFACRRFPRIGLELLELLRLHKLVSPVTRANWFHGGYFDHETKVDTDAIWGTFFLFPTRVLHVFPDRRLPETFFMYGEDMEWCFLLRRAGFSILYVPAAEVIHMMGGSGFNSESGGASGTIYRNRIRFLKKYRGRAYAAAWALVRYLNVFSARGVTRRADLIAAREMFSELFGW